MWSPIGTLTYSSTAYIFSNSDSFGVSHTVLFLPILCCGRSFTYLVYLDVFFVLWVRQLLCFMPLPSVKSSLWQKCGILLLNQVLWFFRAFLNSWIRSYYFIRCYVIVMNINVVIYQVLRFKFFRAAFLLYAAIVLAAAFVLIFRFAPQYGQTHIMVYIGICSLVGSLSVWTSLINSCFHVNTCNSSQEARI